MYDSILAHVSQFIQLEPIEIEYFTSLLRYKVIRKHQYLVQAGAVCKFDSFVLKVCLRMYYVDDRGGEHVVQFAVESWWTGDLYSFLSQSPAAYNTDALDLVGPLGPSSQRLAQQRSNRETSISDTIQSS